MSYLEGSISRPLWWLLAQLKAYAPVFWIFSTLVGVSCQGYLGDRCLSNSSGCFGELCLSRIALLFIFAVLIWVLVWAKRYNRYARVLISIISHPVATVLEIHVLAYLFRRKIYIWYPEFLEFGRSEWWANEFLHPSRWSPRRWLIIFIFVSLCKGSKVIAQTYSYFILTNPHQPARTPKFQPRDITVIIPTAGSFGTKMEECIKSILDNHPREILISAAGQDRVQQAVDFATQMNTLNKTDKVQVVAVMSPSKRELFIKASHEVETRIIATADENVLWPETFLRSALAPFEDDNVCLVGTAATVTQDRRGDFIDSFINYLACLQIEEQNYENTATYNLDGGVSLISSQTFLIRTDVVRSFEYESQYRNELYSPPVFCHPYWPYQLLLRILLWFRGQRNGVGPMSGEEDYFNTRYMVNHGFKTVFHSHPDATIRIRRGVEGFAKFTSKLLRSNSAKWRSNSTSLFREHALWTQYPWTTYAVFLSSLFNFTLFVELLLFISLLNAGYEMWLCSLAVILGATKLITPLIHIGRGNWADIVYVPFGILFDYFHSLVKIWAFLTSTNLGYSDRNSVGFVDGHSEIEKIVEQVLSPFLNSILLHAALISATWDSFAMQIGKSITSVLLLLRHAISALDHKIFGNIAINVWNYSTLVQFRQVLYDHTIDIFARFDANAWMTTLLGICFLFTSQIIYSGLEFDEITTMTPAEMLIIAILGVGMMRLGWAAAKTLFPGLGWAAAIAQLRSSAAYSAPSLGSLPSRPDFPSILSYRLQNVFFPRDIMIGINRRLYFFCLLCLITLLGVIYAISLVHELPGLPWNIMASTIPVKLPTYNIDRLKLWNVYCLDATDLINEWSAIYIPNNLDHTIRSLTEQAISAIEKYFPSNWVLEEDPFQNMAVMTLAIVGCLLSVVWVVSVVLDFEQRVTEAGTGVLSLLLLAVFLAWVVLILLFVSGYIVNNFVSVAADRVMDYIQDSRSSGRSSSSYVDSFIALQIDTVLYYGGLLVIAIILIPNPGRPSGGSTNIQVVQAGVAILDVLWLALRYVAVFGFITFLRFIRWRRSDLGSSTGWFPADLPGYAIALLIILVAVLLKTGGFDYFSWRRTHPWSELLLEENDDSGAGGPLSDTLPGPPTPRNSPWSPSGSRPLSIGSQPHPPLTPRPPLSFSRLTRKAFPQVPKSPPQTPFEPRPQFVDSPKSTTQQIGLSPKTLLGPRSPSISTPPSSQSTFRVSSTSKSPRTSTAQFRAEVAQLTGHGEGTRQSVVMAWWDCIYEITMMLVRKLARFGRRGENLAQPDVMEDSGPSGDGRYPVVPQEDNFGNESEDDEFEKPGKIQELSLTERAIEDRGAYLQNHDVYAQNDGASDHAASKDGRRFGYATIEQMTDEEEIYKTRKGMQWDDADPTLDFLPFAPRKSPRACGFAVH